MNPPPIQPGEQASWPAAPASPRPASPIALVAAVRDELRPVAEYLNLRQDPPWLTGQVHGHKVVAAVTGIGRRRAIEILQVLLEEQPIAAIFHIGFAGALDSTLRPGQVLQVTRLMEPGGQMICLADHGAVVPQQRACDRTAARPGNQALAMVSLDHLVATPQAKRQLRQQTGASLVDMESFAVARLAMERRIPIAMIRAISDPANMAVPSLAPHWVSPDGSHNLPRVLWHLVLRPWLIPPTVRLALHARRAASNLARAVETILKNWPSTVSQAAPQQPLVASGTPHRS